MGYFNARCVSPSKFVDVDVDIDVGVGVDVGVDVEGVDK